ncbi:hypothetical protein Sfulv_60480 [Streptomyces fulvorobeus]|nr:CHAT domain-containing protein [Streptomyces fulvorobeus]GFN01238.1 hypothetical protein Sfulv_60480 [Streptomyces fulvorobeus]
MFPQTTANLVLALRTRYERAHRRQDLDEAIEVGLLLVGDRDCRNEQEYFALLAYVGGALRLRHDHFGDYDDLRQALLLGKASVAPGRTLETYIAVICHEELSATFHSAHLRTGEYSYVDSAIIHLEATAALTERLGRVGRRAVDQAALGRLWCDRSVAQDAPSPAVDALKAITELSSAMRHIPPSHRMFGPVRREYARALRYLAAVQDNMPDVTDALDLAATLRADLVTDLLVQHPERLSTLHLLTDPSQGGTLPHALLDFAADVMERTLTEVDSDDPEYARCLLEQARISAVRETNRAHAVQAAREAADHATADLATRIEGALLHARTAQALGWFPQATRGYEQVITLLPRAASRALRRGDQEHQLARWEGIPSEAAACALAEGRPEQAVQLLEQGRGVLLARALATRGDVAELREAHPQLARRLDELRARETEYENTGLTVAGSTAPATTATPGAALVTISAAGWAGHQKLSGLRQQLAEGWDALLDEIRACSGFQDFAQPPHLGRLKEQAVEGPIVYVNVASFRSDALILLPDQVKHLPLSVTPHDVETQLHVLRRALTPDTGATREAQSAVHDVLEWMWDELAEPVLNAMPDGLRRLWWVPAGQLTQLPLHAAGHHRTHHGQRPRTVLDRVVSSYTPTVGALVAARARPSAEQVRAPLVVAVSSASGHRPLAFARNEAELLRGLYPAARVLTDTQAVAAEVRAALPEALMVHFACHALASDAEPSEGRLLLHDHEASPFTVGDISRLNLHRAELAVLSSCDTARIGPRLQDEVIHLASSFQVAGFAQVVAVLWMVDDEVGHLFAQDFHQRLAKVPLACAAQQVHEAVLRARERAPNFPVHWAGHLHVGR